MPPVQKNSVVPKKQASKVWRYLGHNLDGAIAKCLLCKYNPTKGDAHESSLVNRYSSGSALVIKVCQGSPKVLRNLLQAYHKKEFAEMVKEEEEEEEKFKVPHKVKNEVFPTVA